MLSQTWRANLKYWKIWI